MSLNFSKMDIFYWQLLGLIMLRFLLFFLCFSVLAAPMPPTGFQDSFWQQVQIQNLQSQQQLQSQDQYRRQVLFQDQQMRMKQLEDQQNQLEDMQRSLMIHQDSNQLMIDSYPRKTRLTVVKRKHK